MLSKTLPRLSITGLWNGIIMAKFFRSTWQAMRDREKGEPVPVVADSV